MDNRWAFVLALAVCAGAWLAVDVPLLVGVAAVGLALALRRPALLAAGGFVLAAALSFRAEAGLVPPPPETYAGEVVLLSDPAPFGRAVRTEVRIGRRRAEAWAQGAAADGLRGRLAGEVVVLEGRLRPVPTASEAYLHTRHVAARLDVSEVGGWRPGNLPSRGANGLRRTLEAGARPLAADRRALLLGMTIGDDRGQPVEVTDDFRGAGLTHLLAVSGQNVAFLLTVARPVLSRLGLGWRWTATLGLLALFALLTRFEPSVLRAVAMAAIAATAAHLGRPADRLRILALAVAGLVLVDPFLVRSVGFQLSVGATAGIALLAAPMADRLPGPRWLAEPLAVTLAAQVGVAPVLLPVFGGIPVASVPANLLAVPVAGPVMAWGMTAGLAAGAIGPPLDGLLHLPTSLLVGWVAGVARTSSRMGLGLLGAVHVIALLLLAIAVAVTARRSRLVAWCGAVCLGLVAFGPSLWPTAGAMDGDELTRGATLWRRDTVVLSLDGASAGPLLGQLRLAGVRRIDAVVSRRGNRTAATTVGVLRSRFGVGIVLAPRDHALRDAVVPAPGVGIVIGDLTVTADSVSPTLEVAIAARGP